MRSSCRLNSSKEWSADKIIVCIINRLGQGAEVR